MKLFIIQEILIDYTSGMVVIAANDKDECREIFLKEFVDENSVDENGGFIYSNYKTEFDNAVFKVIESVGIDEPGLVDYIYGGS
jgi:ribonuclease HIII